MVVIGVGNHLPVAVMQLYQRTKGCGWRSLWLRDWQAAQLPVQVLSGSVAVSPSFPANPVVFRKPAILLNVLINLVALPVWLLVVQDD
jgi:hypothetical protein